MKVPHDNNTLLALFSKASSHKMRQLALRSASKQSLSVLASTLAVDLGSVSVLRTASGIPDNRSLSEERFLFIHANESTFIG